MGDRVDVEIPGALLVEREILEMDVRFHRRLIESSAGAHCEIGDPIRREPAGLQAREAGEIEVTSGKIQAEGLFRRTEVRCTDGEAPGKWGAVGTGIDVVELQFVARDAEIALQQWNPDSVGRALVDLEVSIPVRIGARARNVG